MSSGTQWNRPLVCEQLVDVLRFFDTLLPVAEQVIDVRKIFVEDVSMRTPDREPQLAEQLVEVSTILCFLKQTVDIPVPRGPGRRLQGFLPEQSPTAQSVEQLIDMVENFKVHAQDRIPQPHLRLRMRHFKGVGFRTFPRPKKM